MDDGGIYSSVSPGSIRASGGGRRLRISIIRSRALMLSLRACSKSWLSVVKMWLTCSFRISLAFVRFILLPLSWKVRVLAKESCAFKPRSGFLSLVTFFSPFYDFPYSLLRDVE